MEWAGIAHVPNAKGCNKGATARCAAREGKKIGPVTSIHVIDHSGQRHKPKKWTGEQPPFEPNLLELSFTFPVQGLTTGRGRKRLETEKD